MKINGVDISQYEARQLRISIEHTSIKNESEWAAGATVPYFAKNTYGFKKLTLTLLVKGSDRENIKRHCSEIVGLITGKTVLELDNFNSTFIGALDSTPKRTERSRQHWHNLELTFVGMEYDLPRVFTGSESIAINNPGTLPSPVVVTLTPRTSIATAAFTGFCRDSYTGIDLPVVVEQLQTGKVITIDGITGLVTQDGTLKNIDMWAMPSVMPGENTITCSSEWVDMEITVYPLLA